MGPPGGHGATLREGGLSLTLSTVLIALAVFGLLIFIHELGHFLAAKRAGILVQEFALGFGPRLFSRQIGETVYSVRLLAFLGGFVRMAGMEPPEEGEGTGDVPDGNLTVPGLQDRRAVDPSRNFDQKTVLQRMGVIAAGPAMNFALGILLFALLFRASGVEMPVVVLDQVEKGSPADVAGLLPNDQITAVNGAAISGWADLVTAIQENAGKPLRLTVKRQESELTVTVVPTAAENGKGRIGIGRKPILRKVGMLEALSLGFRQTAEIVGAWFKVISLMFKKQAPVDLAGPVGITVMIGHAAKMGWMSVVALAASLSTQLGLINLLPLPVLDGSRLVFLTIEGVRGRPVDPRRENLIHFIGFVLIILLAVVITYRDLIRLVA